MLTVPIMSICNLYICSVAAEPDLRVLHRHANNRRARCKCRVYWNNWVRLLVFDEIFIAHRSYSSTCYMLKSITMILLPSLPFLLQISLDKLSAWCCCLIFWLISSKVAALRRLSSYFDYTVIISDRTNGWNDKNKKNKKLVWSTFARTTRKPGIKAWWKKDVFCQRSFCVWRHRSKIWSTATFQRCHRQCSYDELCPCQGLR